MAKKTNRTWATRDEAIAVIAEAGTKQMTGVEALAALFNSKVEDLQKSAQGLSAGIIARKRAEAAKLATEIAAAEKQGVKVAS